MVREWRREVRVPLPGWAEPRDPAAMVSERTGVHVIPSPRWPRSRPAANVESRRHHPVELRDQGWPPLWADWRHGVHGEGHGRRRRGCRGDAMSKLSWLTGLAISAMACG